MVVTDLWASDLGQLSWSNWGLRTYSAAPGRNEAPACRCYCASHSFPQVLRQGLQGAHSSGREQTSASLVGLPFRVRLFQAPGPSDLLCHTSPLFFHSRMHALWQLLPHPLGDPEPTPSWSAWKVLSKGGSCRCRSSAKRSSTDTRCSARWAGVGRSRTPAVAAASRAEQSQGHFSSAFHACLPRVFPCRACGIFRFPSLYRNAIRGCFD